MAYTLKLSNGTILLSLPDQQSDSVSTSLTLIGKNVNAYGTDLNDNFIKLMENFAGSTYPNAPLNGQLWFDDVSKQLKVYIKTTKDSGYFKSVGSPYIAPSAPNTLATGDFWYDSATKQMKFQADSTSTIVVGPAYDSSVGKSGWVNEYWKTNAGTTATVLSLYVNDTLVEFVSERAFDVSPLDPRYSTYTQVQAGHTAIYNGSVQNTFIGTATFAENLIDARYGTSITVEEILTDSTDTTLTHSLTINVNTATLTLGADQDFQFYSDNAATTATLLIGGQNENFQLKLNSENHSAKGPAIHIDGYNNIVGMFTTTPITSVQVSAVPGAQPVPVDVDINGTVVIQGNLVVYGTQTNIKTQDLEVVDKNIVLAWTSNVSGDDAFADGGGIIIRGTTRDKSILWRDEPVLANGSKGYWEVTDSMNLQLIDSEFRIYGIKTLTKDTVYSNYAPNLTQVGNLTSATIAGLKIYNTVTTETVIGSTIPGGGNITIGDAGTTQVTFNNKKLWNVGYPSPNLTTTSSYRAQAATVGWVQDNIDIVRNPKYALTIDATGKAGSPYDPALNIWVIQNLSYLYDPNDADVAYRAPNAARARVLVTRFRTPYLPDVPSNYMDPGVPVSVDKEGVFDAQLVVGYSNFLRVTTDIPAAVLGVNRCIKQYVVTGTYPNATWVEYIPGGASNNVVWDDGTW